MSYPFLCGTICWNALWSKGNLAFSYDTFSALKKLCFVQLPFGLSWHRQPACMSYWADGRSLRFSFTFGVEMFFSLSPVMLFVKTMSLLRISSSACTRFRFAFALKGNLFHFSWSKSFVGMEWLVLCVLLGCALGFFWPPSAVCLFPSGHSSRNSFWFFFHSHGWESPPSMAHTLLFSLRGERDFLHWNWKAHDIILLFRVGRHRRNKRVPGEEWNKKKKNKTKYSFFLVSVVCLPAVRTLIIFLRSVPSALPDKHFVL